MTTPPRKLVKTTLYFPVNVHRELKIEAAQRNMTLTEVLIEALERRAFFIKNTPEEPKP
ncbi:MAG: hypothetical protein WC969_15575 [Elusimicrobiota bacterium]|jgi:hypothetical protein